MQEKRAKNGSLSVSILRIKAPHDTIEEIVERGVRMEIREKLEKVLEAVSVIRCPAVCEESELHVQVMCALEKAGLSPQHEVKIAPRCRIDILCGGIGIEIKKNRPQPAALRSQLARYAACETVGHLVVIAPRGVNLPKVIGGKRVTMIALERLWGVSLP